MQTTALVARVSPWVLLLAAVVACGAKEDEAVGLSGRKVDLEEQLARLTELGLTRNEGTEVSDLFTFDSRKELEAAPFKGLVEAMGREIERQPWTPICDRLWMCDFERIEDHGDYTSVLLRLERMTGNALGLTDVEDFVDLDGSIARVSFVRAGEKTTWDMRVEDDWLDPAVLTRYDELLGRAGSKVRLYQAAPPDEYGQTEFLAALDARQVQELGRLTGIRWMPVE